MNSHLPASVFRRVAAFLYDCLLLISIFFVFTAFAVLLNQGNAIENIVYKILFLPVSWFFFSWFWIHGGQTLGMRAWRIKLVNNDDNKIDWQTTTARFAAGTLLFGITLIVAVFNPTKTSLHDRYSGTRVISTKNT